MSSGATSQNELVASSDDPPFFLRLLTECKELPKACTHMYRVYILLFWFELKVKIILNASGYRRETPGMFGTYTAGVCTQVCAGAGTGTGHSVSSVRHQYRFLPIRRRI